MKACRALRAALVAATCFHSARGLTSGTCSFAGDGYCDSFLNDAECDYDGGDCCECDCVDGEAYECGVSGYDCVDPSSTCYAPATPAPTTGCIFEGDGWCDSFNNNAECNYDGGDCCECDCVSSVYTCGTFDYACIDPASTCLTAVSPTPAPTPFPTVTECLAEGDGWCDTFNNIPDCNYDAGDCCECDCVDADHECGIVGYVCVDPASACLNDTVVADDDYGGGTVVTDDDDIGGDGTVVVADDDASGGTVVTDDDGDDGSGTGGPVPIDNDDAVDDDVADRGGIESGIVADEDGDDGDGAPVAIIVGGAVGGAVFLGAAVILACCLKTGRLKGCKCCSSSTPAAGAVPPAADGPAPAEAGAEQGAAASLDAADAASAAAPPPAYGEPQPGAVPDGSQEYPSATAPLPPPPAYEGPAGPEDPQP